MDFSTMILTMYLPADETPESDARILGTAAEVACIAAGLGYNPWFTEHHFRGPWNSNPLQFASYLAPQIPADRYLGFGVLSVPYYHPLRLVESINMLDQLTKGHALFGIGSGFAGAEPAGLGIDADYHGSGRATTEALEVMQRLWAFRSGEPEFKFETQQHRGTIRRRVMPAPYRGKHPTLIRTASRDAAIVKSALNGWPAFIGTFGSESPLEDQWALYRQTLATAGHPQDVVENCLRWCTADWLSVVVADTDAEAERLAGEAKTEQMAIRKAYIAEYGPTGGPVVHRKNGESVASAFAAGGDLFASITGNPDTVAAKLQLLADMDINHLLVRFIGEWTGRTRHVAEGSMRLFAREVMPRFTGIPPLREPLPLRRVAAE